MSPMRCRTLPQVSIKFPERATRKQSPQTDSEPMDLFEYQAKELFAKHNVPTTPGRVTTSPEEARAIAAEIGRPVMVKAQVKTGGRGKAGGVKYAATPDDAYTHAKNILGLDIKGHVVKKLLVSEASDIAEEYYISFLLDRANRTYLAMCSVEGGVEIEEVAATADFRQPGHAEFEDRDATDPLELKAKEHDLNYVKLDGQVGIIGNGAGLVMSTLDVVAYAGEKHGGGKPANFLDSGGGAAAAVMAAGLDVVLGDGQVKSVFVNVFGGITACDAVANGIVTALQMLGDEANKPLVVRLDGNNVDEGRRILAEANHPLVTEVATMDEAADTVAALAAASHSPS